MERAILCALWGLGNFGEQHFPPSLTAFLLRSVWNWWYIFYSELTTRNKHFEWLHQGLAHMCTLLPAYSVSDRFASWKCKWMLLKKWVWDYWKKPSFSVPLDSCVHQWEHACVNQSCVGSKALVERSAGKSIWCHRSSKTLAKNEVLFICKGVNSWAGIMPDFVSSKWIFKNPVDHSHKCAREIRGIQQCVLPVYSVCQVTPILYVMSKT